LRLPQQSQLLLEQHRLERSTEADLVWLLGSCAAAAACFGRTEVVDRCSRGCCESSEIVSTQQVAIAARSVAEKYTSQHSLKKLSSGGGSS
jgi:hypothetical protein